MIIFYSKSKFKLKEMIQYKNLSIFILFKLNYYKCNFLYLKRSSRYGQLYSRRSI